MGLFTKPLQHILLHIHTLHLAQYKQNPTLIGFLLLLFLNFSFAFFMVVTQCFNLFLVSFNKIFDPLRGEFKREDQNSVGKFLNF